MCGWKNAARENQPQRAWNLRVISWRLSYVIVTYTRCHTYHTCYHTTPPPPHTRTHTTRANIYTQAIDRMLRTGRSSWATGCGRGARLRWHARCNGTNCRRTRVTRRGGTEGRQSSTNIRRDALARKSDGRHRRRRYRTSGRGYAARGTGGTRVASTEAALRRGVYAGEGPTRDGRRTAAFLARRRQART